MTGLEVTFDLSGSVSWKHHHLSMNDEIVLSQLRNRLGRPGRFSEIYDKEPLYLLLRDLPEAGQDRDDTQRISFRRLERIHEELRNSLPVAIRREFSRQYLSRQFCPALFEKMGHPYVVQEGPAEAGSDLVVTINDPLLPEFQVGVQVFSYEGEIHERAPSEKPEQLLSGWEENSLDYGVLLTTGCCTESAKKILHSHNRDNPNRRMRLVDADVLSNLFLQYFPPPSNQA